MSSAADSGGRKEYKDGPILMSPGISARVVINSDAKIAKLNIFVFSFIF